jgi:hypothetical protein
MGSIWIRAAATAAALAGGPVAHAADLPEGAFGWMAELAGHCWTAAYPDGTRDTQCYRTQYGRYLRGTIEIVAGGGRGSPQRPRYRGDSVLYWDPERSEMAVHYWSSAGSHGVSTGRIEGGTIVFAGLPRRDGTPPTRTLWTQAGPDAFRVVRQRRNGERWSEVLSLGYSRGGSAPGGD